MILEKERIMHFIDTNKDTLANMSDYIFDHPEVGYHEFKASKLLTTSLRENGFAVTEGYAGLETAFRAVYQNGVGGPTIGLLCEYDALENLGHACAHHFQGPSVLGAAYAIKACLKEENYCIEVIGTPAEETAEGGKTIMLDNGGFEGLDVALMMHGGDATVTDVRSLALSEYLITFEGKAAHSAIAPEKGRSALEAMMLAFNGISYLRGHVLDDIRIHGIIENGGQVVNAIPEKVVGRFEFRSYSRAYLENVIKWALDIFEGAALMTQTKWHSKKVAEFHNKVPVMSLNDLLMENAKLANAEQISPPREKTGSTDFASVMYYIPGSCIRVPFVEKGITSHGQQWIERGKTEKAHDAIVLGSKILAMSMYDMITKPDLLVKMKEEFMEEKKKTECK